MGKYFTTALLLLLLALPAGFISAQTATPTASPTPTPTPTATPEDRGLIPVGTIMAVGSSTQPSSAWLACDGSIVSRTTYAHLFAVIGTTYGVGDGSTTFGLPDLRSRLLVGVGQGTGLSNRTMGQYLGSETHTLTVTEMPAHTHVEIGFASGATSPVQSIGGNRTGSATNLNNTGSTGGGAAFGILNPAMVAAYFIYAGEPLEIGEEAVMEPTATPDGLTVYSTVVYGETSQTVAVRYEVTAGDAMILVFLVVLVGLVMVNMLLTHRNRKGSP
jgi:microcystin-dependent protein